MAGARRDPFKNYSFLVEIDGIASSAFKSVSGLAAEAEVIEYREGSDPVSSSRKLPGRVRYPNVRLSRGLTTSRDLWDWWETVVNGTVERRNVAITLLDDSRNAGAALAPARRVGCEVRGARARRVEERGRDRDHRARPRAARARHLAHGRRRPATPS